MARRLRWAAAAASLLLAAALAGCQTTADSSATVGLHGSAGAADPSYAALAAPLPEDSLAPGDAAAAQDASLAADETGYYVEFRARAGPIFHTYMLYGPQDEEGRPLAEHFAGFHPEGGALGLLAGSAPIPVPGGLDKVWSDDHLPVLTSYRAEIGAAQYRNMVAFIDQERRKQKYWNLWVYNCNNFAAEVARAAGLEAPAFTTVIPPIYVAALGAMNKGEPVPTPAKATAASWTASASYDRRSYSD